MKKKLVFAVCLTLAVSVSEVRAQIVHAMPGSAPSQAASVPPESRTISGTVTDPSGNPVSGVGVKMIPAYGGGAVTDDGGRYSFTWQEPPPGPFTSRAAMNLLVRDQTRNLSLLQELDPTASNADLRLQPGLELSAHIYDSGGRPIHNAAVAVILQTGNISYNIASSVLSGADGDVSLRAVPRGPKYSVSVQASGYGNSQTNVDAVAVTGDRLELAIILQRADLPLAGVVFNPDGQPAAGITVRFNGAGISGNSVTDERGRFGFSNAVAGPVTITASGDSGGYVSLPAQAGATNLALRLTTSTRTPGRFASQAPPSISGLVTDPSGSPAAGVGIFILNTRTPLFINRGQLGTVPQTDTNGRYHLPLQRVTASDPGVLIARDERRNLAAFRNIDVNTTNADLQLAQAVTLSANVRNSDDKPVTNASAVLSLYLGDTAIPLGNPLTPDANGRVEIKGLPAGQRYSLVASAGGFVPGTVFAEPRETAGPRLEIPKLVLRTATRSIGGRFLDADGNPVAGATVNLSGGGQSTVATQTDRDGWFRFDDLVDGMISITATGSSRSGQRQMISTSALSGTTNLVLRTAQSTSATPASRGAAAAAALNAPAGAVTVTGRILSANGDPVPGVPVHGWPNVGGGPGSAVSDLDGVYSVTWHPTVNDAQQHIAIGLLARDDANFLAGVAAVDSRVTNQDIVLKPYLHVSGSVKDAEGRPIPNAAVQIESHIGYFGRLNDTPLENSRDHSDKTTDQNGDFVLTNLPQGGQYNLSIRAPGYPRAALNLTTNLTQTAEIRIQPFVLRGATLDYAGTVEDENGTPLSGADVYVTGPGQPSDIIHTDSRGYFQMKVAEGAFTARANYQARNSYTIQGRGGETNAVISLVPGTTAPVSLTGVVTDPAGKPAAGVRIYPPGSSFQPGAATGDIRTDSQGRYTMNWRPPARGRAGAPTQPTFIVASDAANNLAAVAKIDAATSTKDLTLAPGVTVSGLIVDEFAQPIAGGTVLVTNYFGDPPQLVNRGMIRADENGRFKLDSLPRAISVGIQAQAGGHAAANARVPSRDTDQAEFQMAPITLLAFNSTVAGRVENDDGTPAVGATVIQLEPSAPASQRATTDAGGKFHLKTTFGKITIRAQAAGPRLFTSVSAQGGESDIVVRLPPSGPTDRAGGVVISNGPDAVPGVLVIRP